MILILTMMANNSIINDVKLALNDVSTQVFFSNGDELRVIFPCEFSDIAVIAANGGEKKEAFAAKIFSKVEFCGIYANITLAEDYLVRFAENIAACYEYPMQIENTDSTLSYTLARLDTLSRRSQTYSEFLQDDLQRKAFLHCVSLNEIGGNAKSSSINTAIKLVSAVTEKSETGFAFCDCVIRLLWSAMQGE